MSKILKATCEAGVVKVNGYPVDVAEVFSEGVAPSEGALLMEKDKAFYVTSSSTDLKTTIDKLALSLDNVTQALNKIGQTITSIGSGMTGPSTAPPPTLAADVLEITNVATELGLIKGELDALKENLK